VVRLSQLAADAGYDSEGNHEFARNEHGIRTIIPAKHGRPTDKLPSGRYRRLMKVRFDRAAYRRRSQVETVVSMIKRRQGAHVHARSYHSQCRELRLIVLTHNIMILVVVELFYTACQEPFRLHPLRQSPFYHPPGAAASPRQRAAAPALHTSCFPQTERASDFVIRHPAPSAICISHPASLLYTSAARLAAPTPSPRWWPKTESGHLYRICYTGDVSLEPLAISR
jgi:hypothetical protein